MLDSVLRGEPLGKNVVAAASSEEVISYVAKAKNAVGFLGISWIGNGDDSAQLSHLKKVRLARLESTDSVNGFVLPVQYLGIDHRLKTFIATEMQYPGIITVKPAFSLVVASRQNIQTC